MFDAESDQAPTQPSDLAIAVAERHLRMLQAVGELAMEATRACGALVVASAGRTKAVITEEDGAWSSEQGKAVAMHGHREIVQAFQGVTRALRLTLALETATAERLGDLRAGVRGRRRGPARDVPEAPAGEQGDAPAADLDPFRDKVRELVSDAIAQIGDPDSASDLLGDLRERLTETDRFGPLMFKPLREVVRRICADIGLAPDWSQWTGEGWTPEFSASRGPDWPLPWKPRRSKVRAAIAETLANLPASVARFPPPPSVAPQPAFAPRLE